MFGTLWLNNPCLRSFVCAPFVLMASRACAWSSFMWSVRSLSDGVRLIAFMAVGVRCAACRRLSLELGVLNPGSCIAGVSSSLLSTEIGSFPCPPPRAFEPLVPLSCLTGAGLARASSSAFLLASSASCKCPCVLVRVDGGKFERREARRGGL